MRSVTKALAVAAILGLCSIPASVATTPALTSIAIDDQPHMQQALDALRQARRHLEAAIPDKGGHRTAAIKACDDAIRHTEGGIKYANQQK